MESDGEITSGRWTPTKRQETILKQVFNSGERNPSSDRIKQITKLLKDHGDVEENNVIYWFQYIQNSQSRNKPKQQKNSMQESSLNQKENVESCQAVICSSPTNGRVYFVCLNFE